MFKSSVSIQEHTEPSTTDFSETRHLNIESLKVGDTLVFTEQYLKLLTRWDPLWEKKRFKLRPKKVRSISKAENLFGEPTYDLYFENETQPHTIARQFSWEYRMATPAEIKEDKLKQMFPK